MTFDEEEVLFDNIQSVHNDNYLIADTTWRFFLKIEEEKLFTCHSVKVGWSTERPGEIDKQFQFVEIDSFSNNELILKLGDKKKKIEVLNSDAKHYFGR